MGAKNFVNQFKNTRRLAGLQGRRPLGGLAGLQNRRPLGGLAKLQFPKSRAKTTRKTKRIKLRNA